MGTYQDDWCPWNRLAWSLEGKRGDEEVLEPPEYGVPDVVNQVWTMQKGGVLGTSQWRWPTGTETVQHFGRRGWRVIGEPGEEGGG